MEIDLSQGRGSFSSASLQYSNFIAYSNNSSRHADSLMSRTMLKDLLLETAAAGLGEI